MELTSEEPGGKKVKISFHVLRMDEDTLSLFGEHPESTGDLLAFLKRHFGKPPKGFVPVGGLMSNLRMEGIEARQWWSDNVSRYVHQEPGSEGKSPGKIEFFLEEGGDGKPILSPDARV